MILQPYKQVIGAYRPTGLYALWVMGVVGGFWEMEIMAALQALWGHCCHQNSLNLIPSRPFNKSGVGS
jgi:hypothetical protein